MPLQRLVNKLVLKPTTHSVEAEGAVRRLVPFESGHIEVWMQRAGMPAGANGSLSEAADDVQLFLLKFVGNAGRAERAGSQPADYWGLPAEVWAVNLPGYGGSTGPAGVRRIAPAARAVYGELQRMAAGRPIVVAGNSLGTTAALHLAATHSVAGLILRNPVPLRQLIVGRHGWWNLWLPAMLLASQVPAELGCARNAARTRAPAIFVLSSADRLVPPRYQRRIIDAYAGDKCLLVLEGAEHHTPMTEAQEREYARHLDWLLPRAVASGKSVAGAPPPAGNSRPNR